MFKKMNLRQTSYRTWFLVIGGMFFILVFFSPFIFETNDDTKMMMLISGTFSGAPGDYGVFIHPLLSLFLSELYMLNAGLPWYPLTWFAFVFMAYVAWVKAVCTKVVSIPNQLLLISAMICFLLQSLFYLQFTVVAGLLAFSGYVLLLSQFQGYRLSRADVWLGSILCLLSLMVRKESFFMFTVAFGLLFLVKFGWKNVGKILLAKKWLIFAALLLLLFTPFYEKLNGYQDYMSFNTARAKVIDHPVLSYLPLDEESNPDLYYTKNWHFRDNPAVTVATLKEWKNQLDQGLWTVEHVRQSASFFWYEINNNKYISFLGLVYLFILFMVGGKVKEKVVFLVVWLMIIALLNHFYLVHSRVQSLIFLLPLGVTLLFYKNSDPLSNRRCTGLVALFLLVFIIHGINIRKGIEQRKQTIQVYKELENLIPQDEIFFLDWRSWNVKHLDPKKMKQQDPRLFALGWQTYHPADIRLLRDKGFDEIQEIPAFYYLHSIEEENPLLPAYMNYLEEKAFQPTLIAKNQSFELLYYK
jgi:hypothetical protein